MDDPATAAGLEVRGTEWRVDVVAGACALPEVQPTIRFDDDAVTGRGGVNNYRGSYKLVGNRLTVGQMISTLMAGPEASMQQEQRWFSALASPCTVRREPDGLYLDHADGSMSRLVPVGPFVTVTGTVTYLARIAMLPDAEVVVVLEDSARADAPAITIAQQIIREPGNVPVPFELIVDRSAVAPHARLGLRAHIDHEGQTRWTIDSHHGVDLDSEPRPHELLVRQLPAAH
jgi:uncharacterized lipoprotein YbaY/heat shock protein HslJ